MLLLIASAVHGQVKKQIDIPMQYDKYKQREDTGFDYKYITKKVNDSKLADLRLSTQQFHLRIWSERDVVDIWCDDNKVYYGEFVDFIYGDKIKKSENKQYNYKNGLVYWSKSIDTAMATQIIRIMDSLDIFSIPSSDTIAGWGKPDANGQLMSVADGECFWVEYSTPQKYILRDYCNPDIYKNVKEAVAINEMLLRLKHILNLRDAWETFERGLPEGDYSTGDVQINVERTKARRK